MNEDEQAVMVAFRKLKATRAAAAARRRAVEELEEALALAKRERDKAETEYEVAQQHMANLAGGIQ